MVIGKQVRIKPETIKKLKDIKKMSNRTLKSYNKVIEYLLRIKDNYVKLKRRGLR